MSLEIVELRDATTGASARILPGVGFNCFSFRPGAAGESFEALWSDPQFTTGKTRPSHSGIPLLFPFPGRLRGASFEFEGRTFPLTAGDPLGNAIHGFVIGRPWRVIDQEPTRAVGEFQASVDDPSLLAAWPADFRIRVSYELIGHALASQIDIDNPGAGPLPFGFGTHPYFRVPLGASGDAGACVITVPAAEIWPLADMLPTGERAPVAGAYRLCDGRPFSAAKFDDVFTGLSYTGGRAVASIDDAGNRRRLELSFDDRFRECVVYVPPHRDAICLEPYTCVPDAYALAQRGVETGLRTLAPGESFSTRIDIRVV